MAEDFEIRAMPQALDAERCVLGAMLLDKDVAVDVMGILDRADFYDALHSRVFEAVKAAVSTNKPADAVSIASAMENETMLKEAGGLRFIAGMTDSVSSLSNAVHVARIVKDKARRRKLIEVAGECIDDAYGRKKETDELIADAGSRMLALTKDNVSLDMVDLCDAIAERLYHLDGVRSGKIVPKLYPSGFKDLDDIILGLQPGQVMVVAGRTGTGKTAFALNLVLNIAGRGGRCAVFSLEMSVEEITMRMMAIQAGVSNRAIQTGNMDAETYEYLVGKACEVGNLPILVDDKSSCTPMEIANKCRRIALKTPLDMVVVDYIQLMKSNIRSDNRQQELAEISRNLKLMAKELGVPVVALSQLNRETEKQDRPMLSNLRESGAIEQDADVVVMLHQTQKQKDNVVDGRYQEVSVMVAKNRQGEARDFTMWWEPQFTRFVSKGVA